MKEEDYYAAFYQYSKHILYFVARDKREGYLIAALNYGKHYKKPQTNRNYISSSPLTSICHAFYFAYSLHIPALAMLMILAYLLKENSR